MLGARRVLRRVGSGRSYNRAFSGGGDAAVSFSASRAAPGHTRPVLACSRMHSQKELWVRARAADSLDLKALKNLNLCTPTLKSSHFANVLVPIRAAGDEIGKRRVCEPHASLAVPVLDRARGGADELACGEPSTNSIATTSPTGGSHHRIFMADCVACPCSSGMLASRGGRRAGAPDLLRQGAQGRGLEMWRNREHLCIRFQLFL